MAGNDLREVRQRSKDLFEAGVVQNAFVQKNGRLQTPVPVRDPDGGTNSWFIGIVTKNKLVGFIQLHSDLTFMRYSTFQRHPPSIEDCPDTRTWLDPDYILKRARAKAKPSDKLEHPFLTYDRNPSRIVWAVEAKDKQGLRKRIFVAGDYVYVPT